MKLRPARELDRALTDHVETTHYLDEQTGEWFEPAEPPPVFDPEGDEDAE